MKTFILIVSAFMLAFGFWQAPGPAASVAAGELILLCAYIGYRVGPLVFAAERVAKIYIDRDARPGQLVAAIQDMTKLAILRRKL